MPKVQQRMWSGMMFRALGVFAAGSLILLADVGFMRSISKLTPEHLFLVSKLAVTAVIDLPVVVWLFVRADRLNPAGRVYVSMIAAALTALNVELVSVLFAAPALIVSTWLLRRPRQPLAML